MNHLVKVSAINLPNQKTYSIITMKVINTENL